MAVILTIAALVYAALVVFALAKIWYYGLAIVRSSQVSVGVSAAIILFNITATGLMLIVLHAVVILVGGL